MRKLGTGSHNSQLPRRATAMDGAAVAAEGGRRLRVGVVGSGLAGLHAAWALSCAEHYPTTHPLRARPPEVHLFERAAAIGFDAASVDVLGGKARVDVPMRGFYVNYYPRLAALYRATGVHFARRHVAHTHSPRH
jgi:predicted NAD/FAD-binding protein